MTLAVAILAGRAGADDALERHVISRATWGPAAAELVRIRDLGVTGWLAEQLDPARIPDDALAGRLAHLESIDLPAADLLRAYPQNPPSRTKKERREREPDPSMGDMMEATGMTAMEGGADRANPRRILQQLAAAKVLRAAYSRRQLEDILTDVWFNHFNVAWNKDRCKWLVPSYEREAIRPHVLGRFRDLLGATARHPAMLVYLDNRVSAYDEPPRTDRTGRPRKTKRKGKARGLNENYARELLELHTLGVDGGYTQRDVQEVARCFTGWTVAQAGDDPRFVFRPGWHDPGPKEVLGVRIEGSRDGPVEGERVLDLLARHPATARRVAARLCRRFIADDPPAAAVDAVAGAYERSAGDLRETLRALFARPEFLSTAFARAKVKTPFEYAVSALRALDADTTAPPQLVNSLRAMGQMPYACEPPTGYADTAAGWISPGALLARMKTAHALAAGRLPRTRVDLERVAGCPLDAQAGEVLPRLWDRLVGGPMSDGTRAVLTAAAGDPEITRRAEDDASGAADAPRLAALILGSPEFQRR